MARIKQNNKNVKRRDFLKASSGVIFFIGSSGLLPQLISCKNPEQVKRIYAKHKLTAWVQLSEDGSLTIFNPAAEMGQGSMTSLPVIFAEEMDADWSKVSVAFSPQISEIYGSDGWGPNRKIMLSAGSRITKGYYKLLRKAGAQVRQILLENVSEHWQTPISELSTENGYVIHENTNRRIGYGEIVEFIKIPVTLPEIRDQDLKPPSDFRLIGKDQSRTDIAEKVNGKAQFAIDIMLPDMLYGVYERAPSHGAQPLLQNEAAIRSMKGVVDVVSIDYAVGIIAERIEHALAAKKALIIEWGPSEMDGFNSKEAYNKYAETLKNGKQGDVITEIGDIKSAFRKAKKVYRRDFKNDYVYHAQMEPLNSIVQVSEDGRSAEVWVGSQQGFDSKLGIPDVLGIPPENVKINLQFLGGGFGRRSMTDFVSEGALLAKQVAPKPVKMIWTREDDVRYGAYRPTSLQRVEVSTDDLGTITGFSHYVIGDGRNLLTSGIKNEHYNIPNQYAEVRIVSHGVRLKHWRAVGHGPNKFAIECMIDTVAHDQGIDPVELRRRLMSSSPKALATLNKAVAISGWMDPSAADRAKGIAFLERSGTLSTGVCEISLNKSTGKIKVHKFWSAHDAGTVVQPDNVKAQMEGGIIMGMSSVFNEQITIENGQVQQSNYHDYPILRIQDIPELIETAIIKSDAPPEGVGESSTPLVACAVSNAFYSLTGKQLLHLPFTKERVLEALNS